MLLEGEGNLGSVVDVRRQQREAGQAETAKRAV
jgi:hypothetical protein